MSLPNGRWYRYVRTEGLVFWCRRLSDDKTRAHLQGAQLIDRPQYAAVWAAAYVHAIAHQRSVEQAVRAANCVLDDLLDAAVTP